MGRTEGIYTGLNIALLILLKSYFDFFFQRVRMTAAGPKMLKLEVPGLAENRPSVLKGDKIYAQVYTGVW